MSQRRSVDLPALPPFRTALGGSLLLAAAFPPIDWPWLAWVAPIPWLCLCQSSQWQTRRPYLAIWCAGFLFWLWMLQGIRLAHPALIAGWIALSAYIAVYLPLFIGLTRLAKERYRVPLVIAAPVVWTGLEITRSYFLTGFAIGLLAHTQTSYPLVLQIADLGGGYLVGFVMLTVSAGITEIGWAYSRRMAMTTAIRSAAWSVCLLVATLIYGHWSLSTAAASVSEQPPLRVVLIQGALDTKFEFSPTRARETLQHYTVLTDQACERHPAFDLLVWPESSCPAPYYRVDKPLVTTPEMKISPEELAQYLADSNSQFDGLLAQVAARLNPPGDADRKASFVLGCTSLAYDSSPPHSYNTTLWSDPQGKIAGTYDKMHPVMFGEYIPFADWFPILYRITPMAGGLTPGKSPVSFDIHAYRVSPSICFEDTVPHLLRKHVATLRAQDREPDVLLNITNDGWFWGSAILDLHLRCAILRSVELRKPLVIAANTGLSAAIDGNGRVLALGSRRRAEVLRVDIVRDGRLAGYSVWGDWPLGVCALVAWFLMAIGCRDWWQQRA